MDGKSGTSLEGGGMRRREEKKKESTKYCADGKALN